jgi:hypothetical protein
MRSLVGMPRSYPCQSSTTRARPAWPCSFCRSGHTMPAGPMSNWNAVGDFVKNWGPAATIFAAAWTWATGVRERRAAVIREAYGRYIAAGGRYLQAAEAYWPWEMGMHIGEDRKEVHEEKQRRVIVLHTAGTDLDIALAQLIVADPNRARVRVVEMLNADLKNTGTGYKLDRARAREQIVDEMVRMWSLMGIRLLALAEYLAAPFWRASFPRRLADGSSVEELKRREALTPGAKALW